MLHRFRAAWPAAVSRCTAKTMRARRSSQPCCPIWPSLYHGGTETREARMTLSSKLAVAMIALVAITVSVVGWLNYRSVEQAVIPRVLDRIESQARLVAADLESYVAGARGDIASLRFDAAVNALMRGRQSDGSVDGASEQSWHERIATRLT